jgi:2-amino-4-hydroxy-6-hydroxymethyldihydropteridine diphosphokinase
MNKQRIILALGSNIGDRLKALQLAADALAPYVQVEAISPVYETAAAYVTDQPLFLNAVLIGTTALEPLALLWSLKNIENEMGRLPTYRYGPRVIDIDLIFYGDTVLTTSELTIPHPRVQERDFVLRPLADIAPEFVDPRNGKTVAQLLAVLPHSEMKCLGTLL